MGELQPTQIIQHAAYLQRRGLTMREIAAQLGVDRSLIVEALYTAVVAPQSEPIVFVHSKAPFAGKHQASNLA